MAERKPPVSVRGADVKFNIETEREEDGRWIAEIRDIPGVIVYAETQKSARRKAYVLALRVIADRMEHDQQEDVPRKISLICASA